MPASDPPRRAQQEAARHDIETLFGRSLIDVADLAGSGVRVSLDDGSQLEADLLIGADGVHSTVRTLIDPGAPSARYVGLTNFGGITRDASIDAEPGAWHLIFGRHAFFGYQATPDGDVVWFANVPGPVISPAERAAIDELAWRRRLIERFADDRGPAVALIEAGQLELTADNTHDLGHVPTWHRGATVIIGDAAHAPAPTAGQGASMAAEDAIVLADALRSAPSIGVALVTYEQRRRERVERIVAWGARGSSDKTPGRIGGPDAMTFDGVLERTLRDVRAVEQPGRELVLVCRIPSYGLWAHRQGPP